MNKPQRGITTVEFAIVGALFFTVLFAVIEFGRALYTWNTITEATRRGARVAAVCPPRHPAIARTAIFDTSGSGKSPVLHGLTTANVRIEYLDADGADVGNPATGFSSIAYVRVGITNYALTLLIPGIMPTIPVPAFATTLPAESLGVVPPAAPGLPWTLQCLLP